MSRPNGEGSDPRDVGPQSSPRNPSRWRIPLALTLTLLVAAAMAPLVAFGAFGINRLVTSSREKELDRLTTAARALMNAVERELRGYRETAEVLAQSTQLQRGDLQAFVETAYGAVGPAGGHFVLIDPSLRQIVNTQVPRDTPLPLTDNPEMIGRVFRTGQPEVGDLNVGSLTGHTHFALRIPVMTEGRVGYVLVSIPRGDLLPRVIQEQQIARLGWFAAIIDRNGRIVARSTRHADFFGQPAAPEFLAQLVGEQGRVSSIDLEGRAAITAYHASPGLGWRTLVWAPEDALLAPARDAERFILSIALLAMTLSLASAVLAARVIRDPLRRTVDAARDLAAARPVRYVPSRLVEADEIGRALGETATALRARATALDTAEERLRLAQQVADVGVVEWDIRTDRADASEGMLGIYGEEAGAWILGDAYRGFMSYVHPEDRDLVAAEHERLKWEGGRFSVDFRTLRRGETRWINASGEFTRDPKSGEIVRMLALHFDITARKHTEIELRDRESTLQLALDAAYAIAFTWEIGPDLVRRLHSSEPMLPANPTRPARIADVEAVVHPDDRTLFRAAVDAALRDPAAPYRSRFRIRRPDGEVRWLEEWGRVEREADGTPTRLVGISIDVTERRRVEAELAARLAELESLYEAAPIGLALFDRELRFVRINAALARINGLPVEAHLGRNVWEVVPALRARIEPAFQRVLGGSSENLEVVGETPAQPGVMRTWTEKIYPVHSPQGDVVGIGVVVEEITARLEAERQTARYAAVARATHDALIGLDVDGRIETWNPAAERLFGWTAEEAIGRSGAVLGTAGSMQPSPAEIMHRVLRGESIGPIDVMRMRKNGTPIEVSLSATPMRGPDGSVIGVAATAQDITDRKQREAQMRFVMRELTHRSKNLLAVIQAMARQTARSTNDATEFVDRFADRLAALARSHDLLVSQDWTGVDLHALARQQLAPFVDAGDARAALKGPQLTLKPEVAQSVGMAFHELATNASKYGALSVPGGRIELTWQRVPGPEQEMLRIDWHETGGPPYAPPARRGFGRSVIERMIAAATHGEAQIDWRPEGVHWRLDMPASWLVDTSAR